MTITEFLLARIAEDEEDAREASAGRRWSWDEDGECLLSDALGQYALHECIIDTEGANPPEATTAGAHIARWDPARVLAECEAKRRIVEHCEPDALTKSPGDEYMLRLLASVYVDHHDYDEAWR